MNYKRFYNVMSLFALLTVFLITGCSATEGQLQQKKSSSVTREIPIVQTWNGVYPVTQLDLLPDGQKDSELGYIDNDSSFAPVWEAFNPAEKKPEIDFARNIIIFARNVDYFNRISIFQMTLTNGIVEVLAMETKSALPIEDHAAMALAVIPRDGIRFLKLYEELIEVRQKHQ